MGIFKWDTYSSFTTVSGKGEFYGMIKQAEQNAAIVDGKKVVFYSFIGKDEKGEFTKEPTKDSITILGVLVWRHKQRGFDEFIINIVGGYKKLIQGQSRKNTVNFEEFHDQYPLMIMKDLGWRITGSELVQSGKKQSEFIASVQKYFEVSKEINKKLAQERNEKKRLKIQSELEKLKKNTLKLYSKSFVPKTSKLKVFNAIQDLHIGIVDYAFALAKFSEEVKIQTLRRLIEEMQEAAGKENVSLGGNLNEGLFTVIWDRKADITAGRARDEYWIIIFVDTRTKHLSGFNLENLDDIMPIVSVGNVYNLVQIKTGNLSISNLTNALKRRLNELKEKNEVYNFIKELERKK